MQTLDTRKQGSIVRTPGVCAGKPRIAGHRIRVQDVAIWHEQMGMSAAEIVAEYSGITLEDVSAALGYYQDHRQEIDADIRQGTDTYEALKSKQPSLLEKLATKITGGRVAGNGSQHNQFLHNLSSGSLLAYVGSGYCAANDLDTLRAEALQRLIRTPADPDTLELKKILDQQG